MRSGWGVARETRERDGRWRDRWEVSREVVAWWRKRRGVSRRKMKVAVFRKSIYIQGDMTLVLKC